ncbi:MAG: HAD family hydrolase [Eubacteriales bacterium]
MTETNLKDFIDNTSFNKSKNEIRVTRFSKIYMLTVIAGAVLIALLPYIIGRPKDFPLFIDRAVILLAVSFPAALLYSVKSSYYSGMIAAFENGIILKGTKYLDTFNNIGAAAFDYSSTITTKRLVLKDVILKNGYSREEVLYFVSAIESLEKGRIADTISSAYSGRIAKALNIKKLPSLGLIADVDGKDVAVGDMRLMQKLSIEVPDIKAGGILIYVAVNGILAGILNIKDEIKRPSADAIYELNDMGIKTAILTEENIFSANELAEQTRVREIYSGIFPEQKAGVLESILKQRDTFGKIAYASGNEDDLKALKRADVGIYIGELKGTALNSADAVILDSDLKKIKTAVNIANKTINIVWQNIFMSLFFKALVTLLGVFGYIPLFAAILLDSIIVVFTMLISFMASKN